MSFLFRIRLKPALICIKSTYDPLFRRDKILVAELENQSTRAAGALQEYGVWSME
ncbi:MAG: hypothetical protein IPM92_08450 [Saprospiraceae bacterium]|nr:hypothetical protein [Saprospiraceae bacterium]